MLIVRLKVETVRSMYEDCVHSQSMHNKYQNGLSAPRDPAQVDLMDNSS